MEELERLAIENRTLPTAPEEPELTGLRAWFAELARLVHKWDDFLRWGRPPRELTEEEWAEKMKKRAWMYYDERPEVPNSSEYDPGFECGLKTS